MLLAALALLASPGQPFVTSSDVPTKFIPQFVGAWDKDATLMCQRVTFQKPTPYGLSVAVLESLTYAKEAIDRADEIPAAFKASNDMTSLMTELLRVSKSSSNDYRCAQDALASINQTSAPALTRMVVQNILFAWHQQIELDERLRTFTRKLDMLSPSEMADQMSSMQVDRGKIWDGITPAVNITLLSLESEKPNATGKIDRLIITSAQKRELVDKVKSAFPGASSSDLKNMDSPTFLASLYLTLLMKFKSSDET